jgi:hypothetical protein
MSSSIKFSVTYGFPVEPLYPPLYSTVRVPYLFNSFALIWTPESNLVKPTINTSFTEKLEPVSSYVFRLGLKYADQKQALVI